MQLISDNSIVCFRWVFQVFFSSISSCCQVKLGFSLFSWQNNENKTWVRGHNFKWWRKAIIAFCLDSTQSVSARTTTAYRKLKLVLYLVSPIHFDDDDVDFYWRKKHLEVKIRRLLSGCFWRDTLIFVTRFIVQQKTWNETRNCFIKTGFVLKQWFSFWFNPKFFSFQQKTFDYFGIFRTISNIIWSYKQLKEKKQSTETVLRWLIHYQTWWLLLRQ